MRVLSSSAYASIQNGSLSINDAYHSEQHSTSLSEKISGSASGSGSVNLPQMFSRLADCMIGSGVGVSYDSNNLLGQSINGQPSVSYSHMEDCAKSNNMNDFLGVAEHEIFHAK